MPTLVTLEVKRTVYVIIPDGHPTETIRQLVTDSIGRDIEIEDVTVTEERTVTMAEAVDLDVPRLRDDGRRFTVDEVDWIEGQT